MTKSKWAGRGRALVGAALVVMGLVSASFAVAQPGWSSARLQQGEIFRFQHFTAPYDGSYCVRTVDESGRIRGWRQVDRRRVDIVSGQMSVPGLLSLQAGLAVIPPGPPPPPDTPDGYTRMRILFRTPAGVTRREFAGPIPEPVRAVVNMVESALGTNAGGCSL
jgi:hypothetical protein